MTITGCRWGDISTWDLQDDYRLALVGRARLLAEPHALGDAQGRRVLRRDDADHAHLAEAPLAPGDDGAHGLGRVALAVRGGQKAPTDLRHAVERRHHVALDVEDARFADAFAARFLHDRPEAEAEKRPVPREAHELGPSVLFAERRAADEAGDDGLPPHRRVGREVLDRVAAQDQAFGLDDGDIHLTALVRRRDGRAHSAWPSRIA